MPLFLFLYFFVLVIFFVPKSDICVGTPIVEMFSPFCKLPNVEGWGKDMSEHVAFENLPNYTGKWEQMSGLIKRIRFVVVIYSHSKTSQNDLIPSFIAAKINFNLFFMK